MLNIIASSFLKGSVNPMMMVISASPNKDGLTAACVNAAVAGMQSACVEAEAIDLCEMKISACRVCGNGWGICRNEHRCVIEDGITALQEKLRGAEGVVLITPVYWGQPSERMKAFLDRVRRMEALRGGESALSGKKVHLIAAAGGSGNGTVTCLSEMEAWCRHVGAVPSQRIGITRFNREPMLEVIMDCVHER